MLACQTGSVQIFDHIEPEGPMWSGSGRREVAVPVAFGQPFTGTPCIHVSIRMIDGDAGSNLRLDLSATEVSVHGFTIRARTWSDTRIGRLAVSWLALGETIPEEDATWEL